MGVRGTSTPVDGTSGGIETIGMPGGQPVGLQTGLNTAGADHEVAVQALNRELSDKGFILTSTEDIINWARIGSLHWMTFGLACCAVCIRSRCTRCCR